MSYDLTAIVTIVVLFELMLRRIAIQAILKAKRKAEYGTKPLFSSHHCMLRRAHAWRHVTGMSFLLCFLAQYGKPITHKAVCNAA